MRAKLVTFSQCAAEYIESHKAGWKGEKHVKLWKSSLKSDTPSPSSGACQLPPSIRRLVSEGAQARSWETKTAKTAVDVRLRDRADPELGKDSWLSRRGRSRPVEGAHRECPSGPVKITRSNTLPPCPDDGFPVSWCKLRATAGTPAAALEWTPAI